VIQALGWGHVSLVPMALALAAFHAILAVLGFDVMRYVLRVVLPLSVALTGVLVALYLTSNDPRYDVDACSTRPTST
jgi:purine-cytosine permease-like protein